MDEFPSAMLRRRRGHIPTDGLVFWASLNGLTPDVAETGQKLTMKGEGPLTYGIVCGVPCLADWGAAGTYISFPNLPTALAGNVPKTVSLWCFNACIFGWGQASGGYNNFLYHNADTINWNGSGNAYNASVSHTRPRDRWYNLLATYGKGTVSFYLDGELVGTDAISVLRGNGGTGRIGMYNSSSSSGTSFHNPTASCRVYSRVLAPREIKALAKEYSPTWQ